MKKKDIVFSEIEQLERERLADERLTALKKAQFISELKSGLGADMKANANKVKIIKKPWYTNLGLALKKMFVKF